MGVYRYGFNGKENDNEVKGEGNQQDYGMRIYDPRVGRFLSVDPIAKNYPGLTPYQFAGNTPIQAVDLDGLEPIPVIKQLYSENNGTGIKIVADVEVRIKIINLSKLVNGEIDMNDIRGRLATSMNEVLSGESTATMNSAFRTEKLTGGLAKIKQLSTLESQDVTFKVNVDADIRVINSLDNIGKDDWVLAIVDEVTDMPGQETLGVAKMGGKVAMVEARSLVSSTMQSDGIKLSTHEIVHLLGATDTYNDDSKKNIPNLMNSIGPKNNGKLNAEQMVKEVWQSTLGTWNYIWQQFQKGTYERPKGNSENGDTKEQLKKFISENGEASQVK